ncbi:MAG: hypothetical protein IH941_01195 [Acidobacteria bacterium]|nr:hypothetical protein [Acidobacteriota bacterium]
MTRAPREAVRLPDVRERALARLRRVAAASAVFVVLMLSTQPWEPTRALIELLLLPAAWIGLGAGPVAIVHAWSRHETGIARFVVLSLSAGLPLSLAVGLLLDVLGLYTIELVLAVTVGSALGGALVVPLSRASDRPLIAGTWASFTAATASIPTALMLRWWSPFPLHPAWDELTHLVAVRPLLQGEFGLFPSALSDVFKFNAYPVTYHLAAATSIRGAGGEPNDLIAMGWYAPFVLGALLSAGLYRLGRRFGLGSTAAIVAAAASLPLHWWNDGYTILYLTPGSIAVVMVIWALSFEHRRLESGALLAAASVLHPLMGGLGLLVWTVIEVERRWPWLVRLPTAGAAVAFALVALAPALVPDLPTTDLNPLTSEAVNPAWGLAKLRQVVGPALLVAGGCAAALGVLFVSARRRAPFTLLAVLVWVYLIPFGGTERVAFLLSFLVLVVVVSPFDALLSRGLSLRWTYIAGGVLLAVALALQMMFGYSRPFLDGLRETTANRGIATSFTLGEEAAAVAIAGATEADALIVSDPETQNVLGALAGRPSLGGGPHASAEVQSAARLALTLLADGAAPPELRASLQQVLPAGTGELVLVFAGRTERWLDVPSGTNRIYQPWALTESAAESFALGRAGAVVYSDADMVVLLVQGGQSAP